jgi:hypothetical protein
VRQLSQVRSDFVLGGVILFDTIAATFAERPYPGGHSLHGRTRTRALSPDQAVPRTGWPAKLGSRVK